MQILMVQRFDIANVGCAERIWRQAEELSSRGHEITLVNYPHAERRESVPRLRPDAPDGVRIIELDRRGTAIRRNTCVLREETAEADLVHLWKAYPDTALPTLYAIQSRPKPFHYDWDDLEGGPGGIAARLTDSRLAAGLLSYWENEILGWTDTITTASAPLHDLCLEAGITEDRLFDGTVGAVVPKLAESQVRRWQEEIGDARAILFLGQLEADDFPVAILEAFTEVRKNHPDVVFYIAGDGQARPELEKKVAEFGLEASCRFTGYLGREDAQALMAVSSLFLFPLRDDSMSRCKSPLVVAEAMSHGLPIVASEVGEIPRMLGDSGHLVSGLDPKSWANSLGEILDSPEKAREMGERAKQRFLDHMTWRAHVDRLEQAYKKASEMAANA